MRATVLTLLEEPLERERIERALHEMATALHAGDLTEARSLLRAHADLVCVIVSSRLENAALELATLVCSSRPDVALIGIVEFGMSHATFLSALSRAGTHELVFRQSEESHATIRSHVSNAIRACAAQLVLSQLKPLVPAPSMPLVRCCVGVDQPHETIESVAKAMGSNRKALLRHCIELGLPAPSQLLTSCHLILAEYFLQNTEKTVESIAFECGYPSAPALRSALRRHLNASPTTLRERKGMNDGLARFKESLGAERERRSGLAR